MTKRIVGQEAPASEERPEYSRADYIRPLIKFAGGCCVLTALYNAGARLEVALIVGAVITIAASGQVALTLGTIAVLNYLHLPALMSTAIGILAGAVYWQITREDEKPEEEEPVALSHLVQARRRNPQENRPQVYTIDSSDTGQHR